MNKLPLVSIIILNYNGIDLTINCLSSLKKTRYKNFEIIVVDNGSANNESVRINKKFNTFAKVFRLRTNLGFTGGNNWALKKAKGKYIVLLNNDTEVEPDWLTPLVKKMESSPKIGVSQPKIKLLGNTEYFDYAGAAGGFIDKYGYPFTRGRVFNYIEKDKGQYDTETEIFWASGAACIIRKSIIKKVGGLFSKNLFNYMEEIDFCWRVWRGGYKVFFVPESIIYHMVAATAGKNLYKKRLWEHRNNLLILIRNLERKEALKIFPVRAFLEIFNYVYYFITGQFIFIKSLFLAHLEVLGRLYKTRLLRKRLYSKNNTPIYRGSIAFEYFIKGNKTYSSLKWERGRSISYIILNTKKSGGARIIFEQVNKFVEKGYNARIFSLLGTSQDWFPLNTKIEPIFKAFFVKHDIVIATFWPTAFITFFLRATKKFYFVQDLEETFYKNNVVKSLVRFTYKLVPNVFTINDFIKNKIEKYGGKAVRIDLNLINHKIFYINSSKKKNATTKKIKVLSVISWYNPHKGIDLISKIAQELKKGSNNYEFTLVSFEKKPYSKVFDKFVSGANAIELSRIYKNSDCLLVASRNEGFLSTGLEAMATGCIVFTTKCPGVTDYAHNNENAIVVNKIEDFWEKDIIEKTMKDKLLVNKLRENGLKTAKRYDLEKITEPIEKIFSTS